MNFFYLLLFFFFKSSLTWKIDNLDCPSILSSALVIEIESYRTVVNRILTEAVNGSFKGRTYKTLVEFVDEFGPRMTGSKNLENAFKSLITQLKSEEFSNVHGEDVTVPRWVRGNESANLLYPRKRKLEMLSLGNSIGTPKEGITAKAIVFDSFDDMDKHFHLVHGKIVVMNVKFISKKESEIYTRKSASKASRYGAVGVLISSLTPFSLNTPHTGLQNYDANVQKIPVACITPADAHMLQRMQNQGRILSINIKMDARVLVDSKSQNVIADLKGKTIPEKLVIVSGHLDSWDVGQGVVDNGGGAFISWNALALLKKLDLKPKRTIRTVLWTAGEFDGIGALEYFQKININLINFIMESNDGGFKPRGLRVSGIDAATCAIKEILKLLSSINATKLDVQDSVGYDIAPWIEVGIPGASLWPDDEEKQYWYQHSAADTIDALKPEDIDLCTAVWAAISFVIADLNMDIPRVLNIHKYKQKMLELQKSSGNNIPSISTCTIEFSLFYLLLYICFLDIYF